MNKIKSIFKEIHDDLRKKYGWSVVSKFTEKNTSITYEEFQEFLQKYNLTKGSYNSYTNKQIGICWINHKPENFSFTLTHLSRLRIFNLKTHCDLKYKKMPLGIYLFNQLAEQFSNYNALKQHYGINPVDYTLVSFQFDKWKNTFFEELGKAIDETTKRINLKNKREAIQDKLQSIENDIDYAISDMGEKLSKYGITFETYKNEINTATLTYHFEKSIDHLHKNPWLRIRKMKTGRFMIQYKDFLNYRADPICWSEIKENTSPEEIKQFIEEYFEPWKEIKGINYNRPKFI